MAADTVVGTGLLAGLLLGGHLPAWVAVPGALLGLGFVRTRNNAMGMLLQAVAYGSTLWILGSRSPVGLGMTLATIALIAVADVRRLFDHVLPMFFDGLRGRRTG